ncbi:MULTISPECIES: hypothetical protein [unclassified Streptomyces]|uniref:hypothetical protein n=1 Tax=unclassified Streptomyces TaxID=2593676 RepID=UPI00214C0D02|nr:MULTISPECIES: hypothetical protein [unclassified Streptomyces]MCX5010304.1 hypothetical protein [Streptomyces sp. NBC_00555]MCX5610727.1 hypothetical protein [Streptomyces sp. NBC_00047]UUU38639.1 hypothetical protein JIW86_07290 [Streptomyces sp. NBC_00162]
MGGSQDKRREPDKSREEQERLRRPSQDPVHPDQGPPPRGKGPDEISRRRGEHPLQEERDLRDDEDF